MAKLSAGLVYTRSLGHSGALRAASIVLLILLAALAMAATAMTAVFAGIVMGLTLALIFSSLLHHLSFRHKQEGLVVFCIEAERRFCLDSCLEAGIKGEIILALEYGSVYLWMQHDPEQHALVVVSNVSTLAGSNNIGAERCNNLIGALLH